MCGDGCKIIARWDSSDGKVWKYYFDALITTADVAYYCALRYRLSAVRAFDSLTV